MNFSLSFKDFTVQHPSKDDLLLREICGFVGKGCITAVMGASASGKSVLLQSLSGRIQDLHISGSVLIDGAKVDPKSISNPVSYVPQEDALVGELTATEMAVNTAMLTRSEPPQILYAEINKMLENLGLAEVAHKTIGTLLIRGLSGGQKKRVGIATELIASPKILLLDEPTSGLDSAVAFEVISEMRNIAKSNEGKFSMILSIHQPNSRIMSLFDHVLLLEGGDQTFFGTSEEMSIYFSTIGFPCPEAVTPVDYYLQLTNKSFSNLRESNFIQAYHNSQEFRNLQAILNDSKKQSIAVVSKDASKGGVPRRQRIGVLTWREFTLAYRDPTLYVLQLNLIIGFCFFIGAEFFQLSTSVENFGLTPAALLWISVIFCWVQVFKVFHLSRNDQRTKHEMANNKYTAVELVTADTFVTAVMTILFIPCVPMMYFMMGFPAAGLPFLLLNSWMTSLATEACTNFVTKFSTNPTTSMILNQLLNGTQMIFGAGVFIPWNEVPVYWIWYYQMAIITQSTKAMLIEVLDHVTFSCSALSTDLQCINTLTGSQYPCIAGTVNLSPSGSSGQCEVAGRQLLLAYQGIALDDSHWTYFGYLCCIFAAYKFGVLCLTIYPFERIVFLIGQPISRFYKDCFDVHTSFRHTAPAQRMPSEKHGESKYDALETANSDILMQRPNRSIEGSLPSKASTYLTWTNISIVLRKSQDKLIDNVSGFVSSGRTLALMGPSGAGKTTLLNGLSKRADYADVTGKIQFAGRNMTSSDLTFVEQFDELNLALTPDEHLLLVGRLTCKDTVRVKERINEILVILGLESKRSIPLKNFTGGELKRVSVGIGLISSPNVLFLDEPTTGLDSTAAYSVVSCLSEAAKLLNVAVILTIHQPSAIVFRLLDDILLVAKGQTVYCGAITEAPQYFASIGFENSANINPADFYLELCQSTSIKDEDWSQKFNSSDAGIKFQSNLNVAVACKETKEPPEPTPTPLRYVYMLQYFLNYFMKEPGYYWRRMACLILMAIMEGTIFLDLNPTTSDFSLYVGAMFITVISTLLAAVTSISLVAKDRREAVGRVRNGIFAPATFIVGQVVASSFYNFIVAFVFISIVHWIEHLNPNGECFVYSIFINWGHLMLMEAVLSSSVEVLKNDFLCTAFSMVFLGTTMLFSGFFRLTADAPVWINWVVYMLPLKWSLAGFAYQIFHTQNFLVTGSNPTMYYSGDYLLDSQFDQRNTPSWGYFGALLGYVVLFRCMQYALFAYQTHKY